MIDELGPEVGIAVLVAGLVTIVTNSFNVQDRWRPLMTLVGSVVLVLLVGGITIDSLVRGLITGVAATGAITTVDKTVEVTR